MEFDFAAVAGCVAGVWDEFGFSFDRAVVVVDAVDCLLPVALFDDGVVALNGDGIGGFGRHRDALVVMAAG